MSAPRRWLDGGTDLTPAERRALSADLGDEAPAHAKRAVRAALALQLTAKSAASAVPGALRAAPPKTVAAKLLGFSVLKYAAVGFTASALVSGGLSLRERQRTAPDAGAVTGPRSSSQPRVPELRVPANSGEPLPPEPRPTTDATAGRAARRPLPREVVGETVPSPATVRPSESQRVAEARAFLRSGRASDALVALQALERDEPNGLLVQEREALAIETLAALGQKDAARQRAAAFARRFPASPHLAAVRRASE